MAGIFAKWYWSDWRDDMEVRECSAGARGVWMELLCIAGLSRRPGHVLINGKKPTLAQIKHAGGLHESEAEIESLIRELIANGVCDTDRDGIIVCRRLVRDHRRRQISSAGGKSRQKQIRESKGEFAVGSRASDQLPESRSQESRSQKPEAAQPSLEENLRKVDRVGQALGMDLTTHPRGPKFIVDIVMLEDAGIDFEQDLIPCIEELRKENRIPRDLSSLAYFKKIALARKEARALAVVVDRRKESEVDERVRNLPLVPADKDDLWKNKFSSWQGTFLNFIESGFWPSNLFGPSPLEEGCRAPKDMIELAEKRWNARGQQPAFPSQSYRHKGPKPFWGSNIITFPAAAAQ